MRHVSTFNTVVVGWIGLLVCSFRGSLGYNVKLECLIENRQLIGLIGGSFGKSLVSIIYLGEYNLTGTYLRTLRDRDLD